MENYKIKQEDNRYVIYSGNNVVTTPSGRPLTTLYKPLADRILEDLNKYGYSYRSASSILAWHFTMIDNFAQMRHNRVVLTVSMSFLSRPDWTCIEHHGSVWKHTFGDWDIRSCQIADWFEKSTDMQLTAACCIGNAYESVNIAFELAKIMEKSPAGEERDADFKKIADMLYDTIQFESLTDIYNDFKTFELYYGIHLDENGPILGDIICNEDEYENEEEELDIDNLTEYSVTTEQLVGRNFYHYTCCVRDENQPVAYTFPDFELDESEDEYQEEDEDENEEIEEYLPDDCWVKRIMDEDDSNICHIVYLVVNNDGSIADSGCIEEISRRMSVGGMFVMIPGVGMPCTKAYDYNSFPPDNVMDDIKLLFAGRSMPLDFSFEGKRLPQKMIDEGGNGGSNTEYTYALQSAFRLAYMHMSVDTSEDGIIEQFNYSSYQSSGSEYEDMFSRPILYSDRCDEAMDILLHIYDMYTDTELANL